MSIPQQIKASIGLVRVHRYTGECDPAEMPRLRAELAAESKPLQVQLELQRDHRGQWLRGSITGELMLECQRCTLLYAWPLDLQPGLLLVESEVEEQRALEFADPYRVENDQLPLREIVEDEVLLALPIVPRCQECQNEVSALPEPKEVKVAASSKTANPFAQLSSVLKNDLTDSGGAAKPRRK